MEPNQRTGRTDRNDIVPQDIRAKMQDGVKGLEIRDTDVMNAIEKEGTYRHEHFSHSRDCWIMVRRER